MNKSFFERKMERIRLILELMQSQESSMTDNLKLFQEAQHLIRQCEGLLTEEEQKLENKLHTY